MKNKKIVALTFCLIISAFIAGNCLAVASIVDTSNPHYANGNYDLNDIGTYATYLMRLILSLVGTLSLLAFIYGGISFLLSAGNPQKVTDGINAIKAAVIGLIITFASVLIINLFFQGLGITWNSKTGAVPPKNTTPVSSAYVGSCSTAFPGHSCIDTSGLDITNRDCKTNVCTDARVEVLCCLQN
jgi:hypothetical protein